MNNKDIYLNRNTLMTLYVLSGIDADDQVTQHINLQFRERICGNYPFSN
jgi:hypothetical protein